MLGGIKFMENYDELLLAMIDKDNIELIIQIITDYLSLLESS
jgi:hypothetical protein